FVKAAARDKHVWLSGLQGGRSTHAFEVHDSVDAMSQQRWIWNGIACGADTILFWCWRDEVFGRESSGFGLIGLDGFADERIEAMKHTGALIKEHAEVIDNYQPCRPSVGVLFSPQTYYLNWAAEGDASRAWAALSAYCRGLVRKSIPYTIIEEQHLEALDGLKVLFLPRSLVTDAKQEEALAAFVEAGGTLVCESECGAFDSAGLYRYPEDRFTARMSGIKEIGRRRLTAESAEAALDGKTVSLDLAQWVTPWETAGGTVIASCKEGALVAEVAVGKGRLILGASYFGEAYAKKRGAGFEDYVEWAVGRSDWEREVEILSPAPTRDTSLFVKYGSSGDKRMVFVFFGKGQEKATLRFCKGFFKSATLTDLISGAAHDLTDAPEGKTELSLGCPEWRFAVLVEG
ncbi:MAG: beta-galactosidase trimerization domain-containing protein, partial [Planctomycetia bacterium]|nr:beta-galactosidase trimerization domain-containing protein [Planctomycetia bacterium]